MTSPREDQTPGDRPIRAIVFDFDMTLVDASEAICSSLTEALRFQGVAPLSPSTIRTMIGRPLREIFATADPSATPQTIDAYVEAYRAHFLPLSLPLSSVIPGVEDLVRRVAGHIKLGIATSRRADGAIHILRAKGLADAFCVVIGLDEVTRAKPDPEPVLKALSAMGVDPSAAMMVGDTPDDVEAGVRAGALAVGVTTGAFGREQLRQAGAHVVVDSVAELPEHPRLKQAIADGR